MKPLLCFHEASPAQQQLLAACLVLREALRQHPRVQLTVPFAVYQQVTKAQFGAIFYDTLAAEFADLDDRLQIRVHPSRCFAFVTSPPGVPQ
jgi:hypothetical protein